MKKQIESWVTTELLAVVSHMWMEGDLPFKK